MKLPTWGSDMPWFEQVAWFPLCAGVTAVGLVASWFVFRRRGGAAGLRLASWSLLPLAAYLTGVIPLLWDLGTTIAGWVMRFVFQPMVWAGIAVAGVALVGFVVSGALRRRQQGQHGQHGQSARSTRPVSGSSEGKTQLAASTPRSTSADATTTDDNDDFSDVEEILRRRGIK